MCSSWKRRASWPNAAWRTAADFDARLDYHHDRACWRARWRRRSAPIARRAYDDFARYYAAIRSDARKFLDEGERKPDPALAPAEYAALTMLANQMLNLDEVLNK